MKAAWYPIKLRFDGEIKKQWDVKEIYLTKKLSRRVKGCSDFMYDHKHTSRYRWFIIVEYRSDRLSVGLLTTMGLGATVGKLQFKQALGTLHYGDPDLFDKMVELVESFGPIFEAERDI